MKAIALRPLRSRQHTVEQIDPAADRREQILRPADAHQIARPIGRQRRGGLVEHAIHFVRRFADAQAAHRIAGEIHRPQTLGAFQSQSRIEPALHDRKLSLIRAAMGRLRTGGPADRALHRIAHRFMIARQRHDVIQHHRHVGAKRLLNRHGPLGRQLAPDCRPNASGIRPRSSVIFTIAARLKS